MCRTETQQLTNFKCPPAIFGHHGASAFLHNLLQEHSLSAQQCFLADQGLLNVRRPAAGQQALRFSRQCCWPAPRPPSPLRITWRTPGLKRGIVARVNDSNRTLLPHTHPASTARMSIGPRVGASVVLHDMVLVLKPTEEQDAALRLAIDLQQDAASPSFHHWLTPDDFALHYGVADRDIATVSAWLQDNGLQVQQLSRSGRFITFSGSVGAVERAFRTELHHILRNGEARVSNTADLSVPSALAPVVRGLARLDDLYRRQPLPQAASVQFSSSRQTSASTASAQVAPLYGASASGTHYVGPG